VALPPIRTENPRALLKNRPQDHWGPSRNVILAKPGSAARARALPPTKLPPTALRKKSATPQIKTKPNRGPLFRDVFPKNQIRFYPPEILVKFHRAPKTAPCCEISPRNSPATVLRTRTRKKEVRWQRGREETALIGTLPRLRIGQIQTKIPCKAPKRTPNEKQKQGEDKRARGNPFLLSRASLRALPPSLAAPKTTGRKPEKRMLRPARPSQPFPPIN